MHTFPFANPFCAQILRAVALFDLRTQVSVRIAHIEGKANRAADALSCNRLDEARCIIPKGIF